MALKVPSPLQIDRFWWELIMVDAEWVWNDLCKVPGSLFANLIWTEAN
jgi:hypothetical protein